MGDEAAAVAVEPDQTEPDPMVFSVGEEDDTASEPDKPATENKADAPEYGKQIEELKKQNEDLQKQLNRKFYNLRQEAKKKAGDVISADDTPKFTDAQLLKIMEEHKDDPAVMLQVFKHMQDQGVSKASKKASDDAAVAAKRAQGEQILRQFAPQYYDEESDFRSQTEALRNQFMLDDHPMGDVLTVAMGYMTTLQQREQKVREDERKKVLAEMSDSGRKAAVKNAAPAGNASASGAKFSTGSDAEFVASGKSMGLSGNALKLYVSMRKQAKNQRQVMEA